MVLDKQGYDELVMYLTHNLTLFEKPGEIEPGAPRVMELIEDVIAEYVIKICEQKLAATATGHSNFQCPNFPGLKIIKIKKRFGRNFLP